MKNITVINKKNNKVIGSKIIIADNFFSRFLGLMARKSLETEEGLLIKPCNSVHMMFMRFPLDIVFLDQENKIVHLLENLRPWRISPVIIGAKAVLELPVNTIGECGLEIGCVLQCETQ